MREKSGSLVGITCPRAISATESFSAESILVVDRLEEIVPSLLMTKRFSAFMGVGSSFSSLGTFTRDGEIGFRLMKMGWLPWLGG